MAYSVPAPYTQAIRNGFALAYTVDATVGGVPLAGGTGLQPTGGSITDTTKPGTRRVLNLELAADPGLYDALTPFGTQLVVTARVTYTNQTSVAIPMGVFSLDQSSLDEGGGKITLTAPDKWVRVQRANFTAPTASTPGLVTDQIVSLIQGALGSSETVSVLTASKAAVPSLTWDPSSTSRAQAILDLAEGAGLWVFFDRNGVATITDIPQAKSSANWLIDSSASGVLVSLSRQQDRTHSYNVVVVSSSASGGALFADQTVWDNDVNSPTYAGTDPVAHPETAGPFGIVTYRFSTPLTLDAAGAQLTGRTILSRTVGAASQASIAGLPNPALDAFDALDVLGPQPRYDIPRSVARHIADTVTHSLDVTAPQQIQGRSTRTDPYT